MYKRQINNEIIDFEAENDEGTMSVEIAMQWTTAYSSSVHTFANTINTTEGGMHEEGFRTALTSLVNRYGRDKGIIRDKDDNLTGDDVREGLTAVISIKLTEPQFEGQTKTKLGNTEARTFVQQQVYSKLTDWLDAHPADAKAIINKGQAAQAARVAARKAREATRRKGVLESASMPGKLRDCSSRTPSECEIFILSLIHIFRHLTCASPTWPSTTSARGSMGSSSCPPAPRSWWARTVRARRTSSRGSPTCPRCV